MKILVAYDGSQASMEALQFSLTDEDISSVKFEIIRSVTRQEPLEHRDIEDAEKMLEKEIQNILSGKDIQYETHLLVSSNSAGENLIKFAEIDKVDKIYVGVKKRSKAGKLLLGSTAQHVVLHAPCPVVTVK
jgi:nucleotide-binding universal stress UspA family protein